jgi:hypothetical protein
LYDNGAEKIESLTRNFNNYLRKKPDVVFPMTHNEYQRPRTSQKYRSTKGKLEILQEDDFSQNFRRIIEINIEKVNQIKALELLN